MDRRAALKQRARETKTEAGIYQIRNVRSGRVLVASTLNLKTINGARMTLAHGQHRNAALQADVAALGVDAFVFEVLEVLEEPEDGLVYRRDALERLEAAWLERLQPYGVRGYNAPPGAGRRA
ncbi:GIY-YIG nuclease family protein [Anaeromyxobacter oryzae]|uniref:LuxR family transcriptional regulator n=1 Tax=Anaeromyxobacter oryzae TaxID=2918170 RepID=A0ABM7WNK9_9BACT|nr:GIY-YIG nuclease family protein [Anaeromyxobacter oryzae]BDG01046.1 hypothetical protein AMOR_00420 [Anaeromyxobacter oryzae]